MAIGEEEGGELGDAGVIGAEEGGEGGGVEDEAASAGGCTGGAVSDTGEEGTSAEVGELGPVPLLLRPRTIGAERDRRLILVDGRDAPPNASMSDEESECVDTGRAIRDGRLEREWEEEGSGLGAPPRVAGVVEDR